MELKHLYIRLKNIKKKVIFYRDTICHPEKKKILSMNTKYKNKYKGKRCFILGNGPSLKDEDLSVLRDEYVFTVNQIMRHKDFKAIRTNFHFWADPHFFELDENTAEGKELLEVIKSLKNETNNPICFFPIEQKSFVEKHQLDDLFDVSYFKAGLSFEEQQSADIDFSTIVPTFGTVVQMCIIMAIYMGFSKIYLLGCDTTSLMVTIKSALKINDSMDYAYSLTDNEKRRMEHLLDNNTLEAYTKAYLSTLQDYRKLFQYCNNRSIELVNCSSKTVIDSIPREQLLKVFI